MKVATSVTYKTASLRDMERGIGIYNRGLYGCATIALYAGSILAHTSA